MTTAARLRLEVRAGLRSERGPRPRNEDFAALHLGPPEIQARFGVIAAIADGVGGAKGGRVAAELAVREVIAGHLGQNELLGVRRTTARSVAAINRWLHATGRADAALENMACTLTVLVLRGRQAHVMHVGDTRLYRLRDGRLEQLTTDHVPDRPGLRNVLTRAVGAEEEVRLDYHVEAAREHDRFLLCSDGVHGVLPDHRIAEELGRRSAPEDAARALVEAALAARTGDNATALVLDVPALPAADQGDLELAVAALPIRPVPRAGQTVDGFTLEALLSDGRYSRVFRARDAGTGREAVLKFPKEVPGGEATLRRAFLREGWIAARVRSPWIGEVLELPPERQTCLYTAMPWYAGETLEQRLRRVPRLSLAAGIGIAVPLAKGVAALHRAGIVHRDIKPDNVVLTAAGPRLLDLGVARLPNMEDFPDADIPGTASYMAPELLAGAPGDARSDQFALGVTIYRAFTGAYPYGEIEPFSRPRFGVPAPLAARRPDLPAWLDRALSRAVAVSPADRFEDVIELVFALEHGSVHAAPAAPPWRPLHDRDPVRFWQVVAALLAMALLALGALRAGTG